jgi:hypothetical protein
VAGGQSSAELSLAATPGHDDLPRRHERQEGGVGILLAGLPRAVRWASGGGEQSSVCKALGERR